MKEPILKVSRCTDTSSFGVSCSSSRAPQRRLEGAFVTIGDGRVRLRMAIDEIQSFPVRPLLQPAIEQLTPNELVSVYLDEQGQVIDMVRVARRSALNAAAEVSRSS